MKIPSTSPTTDLSHALRPHSSFSLHPLERMAHQDRFSISHRSLTTRELTGRVASYMFRPSNHTPLQYQSVEAIPRAQTHRPSGHAAPDPRDAAADLLSARLTIDEGAQCPADATPTDDDTPCWSQAIGRDYSENSQRASSYRTRWTCACLHDVRERPKEPCLRAPAI